MKINDALAILGLTGTVSREDIKAAYRRACMKYHPDRNPAGLQMMQAVNAAWAALESYEGFQNETVESTDGDRSGYGDALNDALNAVIDLPGIKIEVCGSWIWISGDTKPVKDQIKAAGYYWASKKHMWYFRPAEWKSRSRGKFSIDEIREKFGSEEVQIRTRTSIAA